MQMYLNTIKVYEEDEKEFFYDKKQQNVRCLDCDAKEKQKMEAEREKLGDAKKQSKAWKTMMGVSFAVGIPVIAVLSFFTRNIVVEVILSLIVGILTAHFTAKNILEGTDNTLRYCELASVTKEQYESYRPTLERSIKTYREYIFMMLGMQVFFIGFCVVGNWAMVNMMDYEYDDKIFTQILSSISGVMLTMMCWLIGVLFFVGGGTKMWTILKEIDQYFETK